MTSSRIRTELPCTTIRREYWRDAADIVERHTDDPTNPDVLRCEGLDDQGNPATYYWDADKQAIAAVKGGKIVTYFKPGGGFN